MLTGPLVVALLGFGTPVVAAAAPAPQAGPSVLVQQVSLPLPTQTQTQQAPEPACDEVTLPPVSSVVAAPRQTTRLAHDAANLELGPEVVNTSTTIQAQSLCNSSMAVLDQGMTNVTTGPRRGYRLTPSGRFRANLRIAVPYDPALIPPGLTDQDVRTFYYDEQSASWRALERVTVDGQNRQVISLTDHFTDFVNATVTVPDHPETFSHNPTSMKDVKAADPGAGVTLIDPPQASNSGEARLSYPIALPPGRDGMAPRLGLTYSSGAGNGWLGMGWDLNTPAVMIDTRWGVPRYDDINETETYTLGGEQLSPVAHRGEVVARSAEKVFHHRVEGAFRKIVRHGDAPHNYWWEVTDKDGTRSFYGGDPDTGTQSTAAVLADADGDVFRWALVETRDLNGNAVRYSYDKISDVGVAGGSVLGTALYPRTIEYTRNGTSPGGYTVRFVRNSELPGYVRRPDAVINARGGFKMVTAELLSRIEISHGATAVRSYDLAYTEGAFRKTLLESITQRGAGGAEFNTHEFTYYDELRDAAGGYNGFDTASSWNTGADGVTAGLLDHGQASALSGALSTGVGGHLYVGFNPTASPTKQFSGGGKVGFNHSSTDGVLAMIDLNGDGLPDKVFKSGNGIRFRLNTSGPDGSNDFDTESTGTAQNLPAISQESSDTFSGGGEVYVVANVFVNQSTTFTSAATYFSDVNGDGLPDLVNDGRVLFNHLENGVPTFTEDSNDTGVPVGGGAVDTNGLIDDYESVYQQQIDTYPLADTLRRWVAPFTGRVRVTGDVALIEDTGQDRVQYPTADGVRVAIQHDGGELWSTVIEGNDYGAKTPSGVDSIEVGKGDHLYFRVQSRFDGAFDQVSWDPEISYLDVTGTTDVNGLDVYRYRASHDFALAGRRGVTVQPPLNGTVKLTGNLRKLAATTDDVTLLVVRNGVELVNQTMAASATGEIPLDLDLTVARTDSIQLRVKVDSPIDVRALQWIPNLYYTSSPEAGAVFDGTGAPLIQLYPPYDVDVYPGNDLTAPQAAWTVPDSETVTISPQLSGSLLATGTVIFTVKRRGELLAKRTIEITGGLIGDESFQLDVTDSDELFFDFSALDPELAGRLSAPSVQVEGDDVPSALHRSTFPGLMAQPYRGWGHAGYNGNRARAEAPITEADLEQTFDENTTYDPRTANAHPFYPEPLFNQWRGPDDLGWAKAASMSSSRIGRDFIDVPTTGDFAGARAVARLSQGSQTAVGAGVSFLSGSASDGSTASQVDYLDLNGDRFPDVVSDGRVQYTSPDGGLEPANRPVQGLGHPRDSDAFALNVGVGGSPAAFFADGGGEVDPSGQAPPAGNTTGGQMTPLGLSAGLGRGDSTPLHDLLDVNGDGLPDRVSSSSSGLAVALNLGYGFADPETWGTPNPNDAVAINDGASENGTIGASLGYNGGIYDFAGGVSLSKNKSQTSETLIDLNGDALLDRVLPGGDGLRVGFNTGNGFATAVPWAGALNGVCHDDTSVGLAGIDWDRARMCSGNTGLGAGVYFTIGIGPLCWPTPLCYIIINPGADGSQTMAREEAALKDVDGDGYADHVASSNDASMQVARNRTGRTNLLKSVSRPLGATIDVEYRRDGNTTADPSSRWVLSKTAITDGHPGDGVDRQVTTYAYANGVTDRLERDFRGYARVTETHHDTSNGDAPYRHVVRDYRNDSVYTKGLPTRSVTTDAAGTVFNEVEYTYLLRDVGSGAEPADPASTTATIFPQLVRTDRRFFEGEPIARMSTSETRQYDQLGNVSGFTDSGDAGPADDVSATVDYSDCAGTYVVGLPTGIRVSSGAELLRHRDATVDCATGNVTRVRQFLADGSSADTDLAYFPNGNLRQVTAPPNRDGQRYRLDYEYDTVVATHVERVTDSHQLVSTATHDLRFGTVASTTDTNNNRTSYVYDQFGRTTSVTGPYEQGGATPTIRFEYHPQAAVPWALSRHLDLFRSATDTIDTALFIDGLKRIVQTKKDATVHTGAASAAVDVMTVSGRATFDFLGRTVQLRYPITEPLGTAGVFNPGVDSVAPSRMTYDVLDRTTSIVLPDDTSTSTSYGFGLDRDGATRFQTSVTDANEKVKSTFRDVRELVTSLQEFNDGQPVWTSYRYDPMDQLVEVRDDQGNLTTAAYDMLGRRTALETEDTGRTETVYDLASNRIAKITANLRAEGERIEYDHDFNRLVGIRYPNFPETNVTYAYGGPGAPDNRAGRVTRVTDESGAEDRFYGKLGEITKEIRSIDSDTGPEPEVYTTNYVYDTFSRLRSMVYPDGETLTYQYDSGGMIRAASGVKGPHTYGYVRRLEYDKFEQRTFMEAGNNVRSTYTYDPQDRRLANLTTGRGDGNQFQNLNYTYDAVGNVLRLSNDVAIPPPSRDGGPTVHNYTYDDLYRLATASGSYQNEPNKTDRYTLSMSYDTIHNLVSKTQHHEIVEPSGTPVTQHKTTYDFDYAYGAKPHAATHIGQQTFSFDANGNQTGWTDDVSGQRRTITWDDENRVQSLFDNGHEKSYKYDDGGERVIKRGPQGETAYVNQFFTMRNREIGTKHVFVGTTRVVSKLLMQDRPGSNPGGNQPLEKDQYYFHADHLGSSNYITDSNGEIYQHTEYFPGGETWVDESSNKQRTPYKFSGKELDEETGLYYYGARYYDPRTAAWQSADVEIERYLSGLSRGGVYNSANLNLYAYAYQNPVKYSDPNGKWVETAWDAFNVGLGVVSLVQNVREGNYGAAALDAVGVVADSVAVVVPIVPGGVGTVIKAARAADAGITAVKAIDKAADVARAADKAVDAARAADKAADATRAADKAVDAARAADTAGDAAKSKNVVYRSLAEGEADKLAGGLTARNPAATNSPASHVAGKRDTQWISTSRSPDLPHPDWGKHGLVEIDLDRVANEIVDLTKGIPGLSPNSMLSRWARNAQEVLIRHSVPPEAIRRIK